MESCIQKIFNKNVEQRFDKETEEKTKKINQFLEKNPSMRNHFKKTLKNLNLKTSKKKRIEEYRRVLCNPGCKGTHFEKGPPDKLSASFAKTLKKKDLIEYELSVRKELFGNKTNILQDDFYKELDANTVRKLKKKGAVSGCYRGGLTAYHLLAPLLKLKR
jgi:hypothetical protein